MFGLLGVTSRYAIAGVLAAMPVLQTGVAVAADAKWLANPLTTYFNDDFNWSTGVKPSGNDVATFGQSSDTTVTVRVPGSGTTMTHPGTGWPISTIGAFVFEPGAPDYTLNFIASANGYMYVTGYGIDTGDADITFDVDWNLRFQNNATVENTHFVSNGGLLFEGNSTAANAVFDGSVGFGGDSTAANSTINLTPSGQFSGASVGFGGNATAANAVIRTANTGINASTVAAFSGSATAANATITVSSMDFYDTSTAGNANIKISTAGLSSIALRTPLRFMDQSTAGSAHIVLDTPSEAMSMFSDNATAGSATIVGTYWFATFEDSSSLGTAHFTANASSFTSFEDNSTAGAGTIINNTGSLSFVDNAAATGTTIVNNDGLQFRNNATITNGSITLNNGSDVRMRASSEAPGTRFIVNTGGIADFADLADASIAVGVIEGAGRVFLGAKTTVVGGTNLSGTFSGQISNCGANGSDCYSLNPTGGSLTKVGTGTLELSGTNIYNGVTTVNGGLLRVTGSIATSSGVIVNAGGTLGGTGLLPGVTLNGGAFAPGASIGTITTGNLVVNAGSTLDVEVNPAGQADKINVNGTATINGGTVHVIAASGTYAAGATHTIITSTGSLTGQFASVDANLAFLTPTLSYDGHNVYLKLNGGGTVDPTPLGQTPNQKAAATGMTSAGSSAPYLAQFSTLVTADVPAALDQLSGEAHASIKGVLVDSSRHIRDAALDRVTQAFDALDEAGMLSSYAETASTDPVEMADRLVWGEAYGGMGTILADGNAAATYYGTGGFLAGADDVFGDWRLGILAGAGLSSINARNTTGSSTDLSLGVYGATEVGPGVLIQFGAAVTHHGIATTRTITLPGVSDTVLARYGALTGQLFAEVSQEFDLGAVEITPFAQLALVGHATGAFTETGGPGAISSAANTVRAALATLGVRAEHQFILGDDMLVTASGSIGWRHAFADLPTASNSLAFGGPFTVAGAPIAGDALVLEAGVDLNLSEGVTLTSTYSGELAAGQMSHAVKLTVSGQF